MRLFYGEFFVVSQSHTVGHVCEKLSLGFLLRRLLGKAIFTRQSMLFFQFTPKHIFQHYFNFSWQKLCRTLQSRSTNKWCYRVDPDNAGAFDVYCDQTTAGGGWAVFQKRLDGSVDFDRVWKDYKQGFGNLSGEFWLGLDKVHRLTEQQSKLRVELEDFNGQTAYAEYDLFGVADEGNKYRLTLGTYAG